MNWEEVARRREHPLAIAILDKLEEEVVASPNMLSQMLGKPLGNVSYHVKTLHKKDLLKLVDTKPRRGAIEHFYELSEDVA